jgi:L-iditol 2-dehydrogenase
MVDFRLKKALEFGAHAVVNVNKEPLHERVMSLTNGKGADIVIAGPNSAQVMEAGLKCTAPGGTTVLFTPAKPDEWLSLDPNYLYFRDINIVTSYSCGPDDTRDALGFIEKGIIPAEKLVTHRYSIENTPDAYRKVTEARNSLKVLITFD